MASVADNLRNQKFRPMEFAELLDHTIRLFRNNWKLLTLLGLINAVPGVVATGIQASFLRVNPAQPDRNWYFRALLGATGGNYTDLWRLGGLFAALTVVVLLLYPLLHGATIAMCARLSLGQPTDLRTAYRIALRRYPASLGTYLLLILSGLFAGLGLVLGGLVILAFLTVPAGFVALAVYAVFSEHVVIIEHTGGFQGIKRSFKLVSGRFWPLLGLGLIAYLFIAVLQGQLSTISTLPIQLLQAFYFRYDLSPALGWALAILSGLVGAIITPISVMALTLAYYDTRMRKEGFDLELLAESRPAEAEQA